MGQDTSVGFGLGYGVDLKASVIEANNLDDGEVFDHIYELVDNPNYRAFYINDGYDTEIEEIFVYSSEPFKYGNDITKVKQELLEYLDSIGLIPYGEFGVVGGVYTY